MHQSSYDKWRMWTKSGRTSNGCRKQWYTPNAHKKRRDERKSCKYLLLCASEQLPRLLCLEFHIGAHVRHEASRYHAAELVDLGRRGARDRLGFGALAFGLRALLGAFGGGSLREHSKDKIAWQSAAR